MTVARISGTIITCTWFVDGENEKHESIFEEAVLRDSKTAPYPQFRTSWPNAAITLRQGARVIEDSRRRRLVC